MTETVSIIIPCYNAAAFLRETLDSTQRQTVPPVEVILVDDGSTDDSASIAESYGPAVRVLRQPNRGESVAMNAALAVARGDYIVFLGSDDVLHPGLLDAQLRSVRGVRNGVACTGFSFFLDNVQNALPPVMPRTDAFFPEIISANLGPPSCWLTPKELILQAGCFHAPQRYFEDWDLNWRVGLAGGVYVPVPVVGFYYRQHAKSQLASLPNAERAYGHAWVMERMCRAFFDRDDLLQSYGDRLFWSAYTALRACRGCNVPWSRLRLLANLIEEVALRRPGSLEGSAFARAIRWVGFRPAEMIVNLGGARGDKHVYRAPWLQPAQETSSVRASAGGQ